MLQAFVAVQAEALDAWEQLPLAGMGGIGDETGWEEPRFLDTNSIKSLVRRTEG